MPEESHASVPDRLRNPHPLVAEAIRHFDRRQVTLEGILCGRATERQLQLSVSPAMFPRATRIADTLLKLLERAGHGITLPADHKTGLVVTVDGQDLRVQLREQLQQVKVRETYGEHTRLRPTGRLELLIDEYLDTARKRWTDGKKRDTIEQQLEKFHDGLRLAADAKRRQEEDWAAQRREREEEERQRQEAATRRQEERQRVEDLEYQVARWERSRQIRAYLAAVEAWGQRDHAPPDPNGELQRWLTWAHAYAERLDPLGCRPEQTPLVREPSAGPST